MQHGVQCSAKVSLALSMLLVGSWLAMIAMVMMGLLEFEEGVGSRGQCCCLGSSLMYNRGLVYVHVPAGGTFLLVLYYLVVLHSESGLVPGDPTTVE